MTFSDTVKRAWNDNRLFSVLVELTYACNLNCDFCYNDLSLRGKPLSLEQYKIFFRDLASMNVLHLTLSGGEPLAHRSFFEIGALARELGFVTRVKTNGHAVRGKIAARLRNEVDPYIVEVSIHGTTAEVHDRQTRVPGSFVRLVENVRTMRGLGLRVKANSTLTRWNEHQLEDLFALCDELDVTLQVDPEVKPRDNGDRGPLDITATEAGMKRLRSILGARARKRQQELGEPPPGPPEEYRREVFAGTDKHCGAGSSAIAVDPFGNVLPCVQWRVPVGNLHEQSVRDIWRGAPGLDDVRQTTLAARQWVDAHGPAGQLMNFCPGAAHTHSGDALSMYPAASQRIEMAARERVRLPVV